MPNANSGLSETLAEMLDKFGRRVEVTNGLRVDRADKTAAPLLAQHLLGIALPHNAVRLLSKWKFRPEKSWNDEGWFYFFSCA